MTPVIVHHYFGVLDGVFSSAIDLYYNLRKFMDVDLLIYTADVGSCMTHLNLNNNKDLLDKMTNEREINRETVICSARFLYDSVCKINCDRLIILDSLDLSKSIYGTQPRIEEFIPFGPDVVLLANKANMSKHFMYSQGEYYQKLSADRINKLPNYYNKFLRKDRSNRPFFSQVLNYKRTKKEYMEIQRGQYFENIGKLIFEHILYGCLVNYYTDGMFVKDGLYYYLKLFGVDGEISHEPLLIGKDDIKDKLFMKEDDLIIKLIKG